MNFLMLLNRFTYTLNTVWFVNSIAHAIGMKPYDKNISPTENLFVSIAALGEGKINMFEFISIYLFYSAFNFFDF